jgi:molybdenum cofactor cytidylyltransferase
MIPTIADGRPALRIVILAAGFSARLGQPKALARVHGASLLHRTLRLLAPFSASSRLIVVVPPRSGRYRLGVDAGRVDFIVNCHRGRALSESVRAGVRRARFSAAVLLLPVDLVALNARDVGRLIARWRGARRKVVACRVDQRPATPLILPRGFYPLTLAAAGDHGLRDIVRRLPPDCVRLVPLPSAAADVDTPHDLERARRRPHSRAVCTSR